MEMQPTAADSATLEEKMPAVAEAPAVARGSHLPQHAARPPWTRHMLLRTTAVVLLAALVGAGLWLYLRPSKKMTYVTAAVTRGMVAPYVTASGSVNPVVAIQVGTYVSGVIRELYCDFNTQVKAGQLCARIDPRPYQVVVDQDEAAVAAAKAQLIKDQANLVYARISYDRQLKLVAQDSTSRDAADLAHSAFEQAQAQVGLDQAALAQRQADLSAAQVNLGYTNITSPVDGTVVSRNVTQGQTVAASFQTPTLFLIATDLTHMQVDASVSESDIGNVRLDNLASFTVEAFSSHVFHGKVIQVRQSPQTIQNVVTYDVVVGADNPDLLLKPGMTADVRIVTAQSPDALRVPVEALRYWPESVLKPAQQDHAAAAQVWTLRAGRPVAVPVTLGLVDDTYAQIRQGTLTAGENVIIGERSGDTSSARPSGSNRQRSPFL